MPLRRFLATASPLSPIHALALGHLVACRVFMFPVLFVFCFYSDFYLLFVSCVLCSWSWKCVTAHTKYPPHEFCVFGSMCVCCTEFILCEWLCVSEYVCVPYEFKWLRCVVNVLKAKTTMLLFVVCCQKLGIGRCVWQTGRRKANQCYQSSNGWTKLNETSSIPCDVTALASLFHLPTPCITFGPSLPWNPWCIWFSWIARSTRHSCIKLANARSRNPPTTDFPPVLSDPELQFLQVDNLLLPQMNGCGFIFSNILARVTCNPIALYFYPSPLAGLCLDFHSRVSILS